MNVKIDFEITDQESVDLILQLKNIVASSPAPSVISKLLAEVQKDVSVLSEMGLRFMMHLRNYTNVQVDMEKRFLEDLLFAPWWMASDNGLVVLCNATLNDITKLYGGTFTRVKVADVKTKKKVKDVVEVLLQKYRP